MIFNLNNTPSLKEFWPIWWLGQHGYKCHLWQMVAPFWNLPGIPWWILSSQRLSGIHLWLNKSDVLFIVVRKNTHLGEPQAISIRGCWRLGLTLGYLREGLELFALNWVLSGSRSSFMAGYFGKPYGERGRTTVRLSCNW